MNGIAAAALGFYILVAIIRGNGKALGHALQQEGGFIKWALAVAIFAEFYTNPQLTKQFPTAKALAGLAAVYFLLKVGSNENILNTIKSFWSSLPTSNFNQPIIGGGGIFKGNGATGTY